MGYEPKELIGKHSSEVINPDELENAKATFEEIIANFRPKRYEWRLRHKDGYWKWFDCGASVYKTKSGELRIVIISNDITERKKMKKI